MMEADILGQTAERYVAEMKFAFFLENFSVLFVRSSVGVWILIAFGTFARLLLRIGVKTSSARAASTV